MGHISTARAMRVARTLQKYRVTFWGLDETMTSCFHCFHLLFSCIMYTLLTTKVLNALVSLAMYPTQPCCLSINIHQVLAAVALSLSCLMFSLIAQQLQVLAWG